MLVNTYTVGRDLYEEIWMRSRFMLNFTHQKFFENPNNFWWNECSSEEMIAEAVMKSTQFKPFVLKFVQNVSSDS
jgi:hypothetical protein